MKDAAFSPTATKGPYESENRVSFDLLRNFLHNLNIKTVICTGIFTVQSVSSTVRSLADESVAVIVLEDLCAAGSETLHHQELEIINLIYCHVMQSAEPTEIMGLI